LLILHFFFWSGVFFLTNKQMENTFIQIEKHISLQVIEHKNFCRAGLCDLKIRFRRTQDLHQSIHRAVNIVVTSCVLHNICIKNGDLELDGNGANCNVNSERFPDLTIGSLNEGIIKLDLICGRIQPPFNNRLRFFH
jgi:hypothetical protein